MPLIDLVTARYDATLLRWLTNSRQPAATAINTTILQQACDDVEGDFLLYARLTFDDTDKSHVALACPGVVTKLELGKNLTPDMGRGAQEAWIEKLKSLSALRTHSRVHPTSTSPYTPSSPVPDGESVTPPFDRDRYRDFTPEQSR